MVTGDVAVLATSDLYGSDPGSIALGFQHETAERYKMMYDRCSAMARIGVWQCDLATEALCWTDGVYDLFDLPRGAPVSRAQTLAFYDDACRLDMERHRSRAIAERTGFTLDVRITTARGAARWIRITAEIECEAGAPVRIFGLKQDVTREKDLLDRLQRLAERDALTGLANRGFFEARLAQAEEGSSGKLRLAALLFLDVDHFKQVNDTFGHGIGDDCLKHVAGILCDDLPPDSLAVRLGGDEFAVLLFGPLGLDAIEACAARLVARSRRLIVRDGRALEVSVSLGVALAGLSDDPGWTTDLVRQADVALYAAKAAGRNRLHLDRSGPALPARAAHGRL